MRKTTDMERIKHVAEMFLYLDIEETEYSPMIVKHPFTESAIVRFSADNGQTAVGNILADKEMYIKWIKKMEKQINTAENVFALFFFVTKSYRLVSFKYVMPYLSKTDFSKLLADVWVSVEAPNMDPNFNQKELVEIFRKADPDQMMTEDEIKLFRNLPDNVVVYRGINSLNAKNVKALSWTIERKAADWFANRFGGEAAVFQAEINKENIFAFFNKGSEYEVVVDPGYLYNINEVSSEEIVEK